MKKHTFWDFIDTKWNYITTDHKGDVTLYTAKPFIETRFAQHYWKACSGCKSRVSPVGLLKDYKFDKKDWKHSLVSRA